uniref:Striatin N-terminal domain-containing protein n=1 Tax=Oncorhynchus tshawytscha TaxID=74940 RepID=A0AAZ3P586_ONCTS
MEAERSGGVAGGTNQNSGGSGVGRNPNGPKSVLGQATTEAAAAASAAGAMAGSSQPREPQDGDAGLSLPGILHFIQFEWGRFQAEKYRWEAERDELRAQVTFLQGERKGQENMKQDLVRRIKMLEYALKQERSKHQKLKTGSDQSPGEKKPEAEQVPNGPAESESEPANQMSWKEGRQLLRKYLEEVGYSDTILDMRSKRVRSLLGRTSPEANGAPASSEQQPAPDPEPLAGGESLLIRQIEEQIKRNAAGKDGSKERLGGSVLDKIPFLHGCQDDDEDDSDEEDDFQGMGADRIDGQRNKNKKPRVKVRSHLDPDDEEDEDDSEDALSEFDFLGSGEEGEGAGELQDNREEFKKTWNPRFTLRSHFDAIRALTFHPSQAVLLTASEDGTLKLWNLNKAIHSKKNAALDVEPIYTFRAHSGAVLSLAMGEDGDSCYSGGLDGTVRCWKIPDINVDPYDNYDPGIESSVLLGHEDSVWSLTYSAAHHRLASCSADGTVRIWDPQNSAPCLSVFNKEKEHGTPTSVAFVNSDPNQAVVSFDSGETLLYDLTTEAGYLLFAEMDARGKFVAWLEHFQRGAETPYSQPPRMDAYPRLCTKDCKEYKHSLPIALPFSLARSESAAKGCLNAEGRRLWETLCCFFAFPSCSGILGELINCVVSHPSEPISITAHENRTIRYLDNKTGKLIHSMVAHLDAVTCLTTDPKGTYLISGSHDCSVRLWMLDNRTCVQEITAHRKKHDEAIHDVAFHPSQPFIASAGADALAKVFV